MEVFAVGHESSIAALGDSQSMDGGAGFQGQGVVQLARCASCWDGDLLWELLDGFAWLHR